MSTKKHSPNETKLLGITVRHTADEDLGDKTESGDEAQRATARRGGCE